MEELNDLRRATCSLAQEQVLLCLLEEQRDNEFEADTDCVFVCMEALWLGHNDRHQVDLR